LRKDGQNCNLYKKRAKDNGLQGRFWLSKALEMIKYLKEDGTK